MEEEEEEHNTPFPTFHVHRRLLQGTQGCQLPHKQPLHRHQLPRRQGQQFPGGVQRWRGRLQRRPKRYCRN